MFEIKVPATSANLGPGFDSIGMALSIYNYIKIEESESKLEIITNDKSDIIPKDETNLIYSTMKDFYDLTGKGSVPNIKITQEDNIPLTRGLGSSAACIVGGVIAANKLSKANLSTEELAFIAAKMEGHPDNSTPALVGGIVVGALSEKKLDYIKLETKNIENLNFFVMIPNFHVPTEKARNILPKNYSISDSVYNISRASLLVACFCSGNFEKIGEAMKDKLHQPYRKNIIDNMEEIFHYSRENGADAVFLSGAGPTIIALSSNKDFEHKMNSYLKTIEGEWTLQNIRPDFEGAKIF